MSSKAFNVRKITQISALLMSNCPNGTIEHVKLIKLLYAIDRMAIKELGFPLSGDSYYSMSKGPILSRTLDLIRGKYSGDEQKEWSSLIGELSSSFTLALLNSVDQLPLDQLSDAEIELIELVWRELGTAGVWDIVDWTHAAFPEWEDPGSSSTRITIESIVENLGLGEEESQGLLEHLEEQKAFDSTFSRL